MAVRIRESRTEDAAPLADLWHEMAVFHASADPYWRVKRNSKSRYADYMSKIVGAPDKVVYVADESGAPVGFVLAQLDIRARVFAEGDHGLIQDLAVTATCRRAGIGQQLVEKAAQWFKKKGVRTIEVRAATANRAATEFWRKMGFEQYMTVCKRRV